MKPNMNYADRLIRTLIAVTLIVLYYKGIIEGTLGIVLILIACVFLITSLISVCPLYSALGLNFRKAKASKP